MKVRTQATILKAAVSIWGLFWFVFALISGAPEHGWKGVLLNAPNAIPEIVFFLIIWLAWRKPFLGGFCLALIALFCLFFFAAWKNIFVLLLLVFPLLAMGIKLMHLGNLLLFEE